LAIFSHIKLTLALKQQKAPDFTETIWKWL